MISEFKGVPIKARRGTKPGLIKKSRNFWRVNDHGHSFIPQTFIMNLFYAGFFNLFCGH